MSWTASTGSTHRYELWQAIDALSATQEGLDSRGEEEQAQQLHHAKAAAKAVCNSFPAEEYSELTVTLSGHVYGGPGSSQSWVQVSVHAPMKVVVSEEAEPEQDSIPSETPETPAEPPAE